LSARAIRWPTYARFRFAQTTTRAQLSARRSELKGYLDSLSRVCLSTLTPSTSTVNYLAWPVPGRHLARLTRRCASDSLPMTATCATVMP
jgi:hypothetical protein